MARSAAAVVARRLVARFGGRFSTEAGIDVDGGDHEVERWFLAATLFGTRIGTQIAMRTYRVLDAAGVSTIADAGRRTWDELVALLDAGGYTRYDFRTASRLLTLAAVVAERHPDGIARLGRDMAAPDEVVRALDALPGWGPTTVRAFLRELRGVWRAVAVPLDPRAASAATHLRLVGRDRPPTLHRVTALATGAGVDPRDLEAALVRLALVHERGFERCEASGRPCAFTVDEPGPPQPTHR